MKKLALLALVGCFASFGCGPSTNTPGGSGGASGSGGKIGSGGTPGGSGGAGGGDECTVGSTAVTGVTPSSTCNGVFAQGTTYEGYFFTFSDQADGGGSSISPACTSTGCTPKITTGMCTCGVAGKVQGTAYATYWGAGVGWNLSQPIATGTCTGGTPAAVDLTGKTIKATISNPPAALRLKLDTADGDNFCLDVSAKAGNINVPVADIVSECWTGGAGTPIPAAKVAAVKAIQFQVPTGGTDVSFNFCITALSIE